MKQIKLLLLLASASVTGALAQKQWIDGYESEPFCEDGEYRNQCRTLDRWILGRSLSVFSRTSCKVCGIPGTHQKYPTVSVILRLPLVCVRVNIGDLRSMTEICINGWRVWLLSMLSIKIRNWIS